MSTKNLVTFSDEVGGDKGKDVKNTSHFNTTARESYATGSNTTKRETVKHKPFGKLGAKGHPE